MKTKSKLILMLVCVGIFFAIGHEPCHGTVREIRKNTEQLVNQARQQAKKEPEESLEIKKGILRETLETIDAAPGRPDSPIIPLKAQIGELLTKEKVSSEDIAVVKESLDRIAPMVERLPERERLEYVKLRENIDIAQGFTEAIDKLNKSHDSTILELNGNFDKLSGQYDYSFYGNIVLLLGLITKLGNVANWRLDRELKRLEIKEKKAGLKEHGIET
jgi:hypothetical protein